MRNHDGHNGGGSRLVVAWRTLVERFRTSLFGLPSLWVIGSVVLWIATRQLDEALNPEELPVVLATTVDSARALLGAVASGTIAAASVVFSLTLVAIQLSSNSYSSRVLRTFLRDRFQQNMMGIVLATFFYSLLVLRDVRGPLAEGGDANVPSASVTLATVLALAAILALLASISHTAQSVRVSHVSASVRHDTRTVILDQFGPPRGAGTVATSTAETDVDDERTHTARAQVPLDVQAPGMVPSPLAVAAGAKQNSATQAAGSRTDENQTRMVVTSVEGGWVQQIGIDGLVGAVPAHVLVRLEVAVGTYVVDGAPLVTIWSEEDDHPDEDQQGHVHGDGSHDDVSAQEELSKCADAVRSAISVGRERTMQQDVAFGLTMLEDIALRALSPGVNDQNTARAIIPQLGELLLEILMRDLPPVRYSTGGVTIVRGAAPSYLDYLETAFGQLRRVSVSEPVVRLTMMRTLASIGSELERRGAAAPEAMHALRVSMERLVPDDPRSGDPESGDPEPGDPEPGDPASVPPTSVDPASVDPAVVDANELLASTSWFSASV